MNEGERMKGATMTENRPRDAVDLLYEAAEFAGFDAGKGWPEELEPGQFVALMVGHEWLRPLGEPRPLTIEQPDGWLERPGFDPAALETGTEKNRKRRACRIAEKRLKDAGLAFEKREDFFTAPPKRLLSLDPTKPVVIVQPSPEMRRWFVVTRKAASDCLKRMGKVPGEYIRAWLGDAWHQKAGKVESKRESIRALLADIQAAAPGFSSEAMPGRKVDFFELCCAWDPAFRYVRQNTFNDYLPGLCKFRRGARATDFYREIAPQIGVKFSKRA